MRRIRKGECLFFLLVQSGARICKGAPLPVADRSAASYSATWLAISKALWDRDLGRIRPTGQGANTYNVFQLAERDIGFAKLDPQDNTRRTEEILDDVAQNFGGMRSDRVVKNLRFSPNTELERCEEFVIIKRGLDWCVESKEEYSRPVESLFIKSPRCVEAQQLATSGAAEGSTPIYRGVPRPGVGLGAAPGVGSAQLPSSIPQQPSSSLQQSPNTPGIPLPGSGVRRRLQVSLPPSVVGGPSQGVGDTAPGIGFSSQAAQGQQPPRAPTGTQTVPQFPPQFQIPSRPGDRMEPSGALEGRLIEARGITNCGCRRRDPSDDSVDVEHITVEVDCPYRGLYDSAPPQEWFAANPNWNPDASQPRTRMNRVTNGQTDNEDGMLSLFLNPDGDGFFRIPGGFLNGLLAGIRRQRASNLLSATVATKSGEEGEDDGDVPTRETNEAGKQYHTRVGASDEDDDGADHYDDYNDDDDDQQSEEYDDSDTDYDDDD